MARLHRSTPRRLTASSTELTMFQTCRRRWYLSRLFSSKSESPALLFGSAIHKGLEGYYLGKLRSNDPKLWRASMMALYTEFVVDARKRAIKEYAFLWDDASETFDSLMELGRKILINYVDFDQTSDTPIQPTMVERRMFIPLDPQKKNVLAMRWDVLGRTYNDMSALVDHKTTGGGIQTTGSVLDLDEQMTSYAYGYWRMHDRRKTVDLIIYDTIAKKIPAPIEVLKSGKLSKAKNQDTVLSVLMKTIRQFGEDPDEFYELIDVLTTKGWRSFFRREASPRNEQQLINYEERANLIFEEMRACIEYPKRAYPSPGPIKCPSCPFLSVCQSMEEGSDWKYLLDVSFKREGKTAYTMPARFKEMTG